MKRVYKLMLALSCFSALSAMFDGDLIKAAKDGNLEAVQSSINQGADIHADYGEALRLAAKNGHLPVVEYLLNHGADLHGRNFIGGPDAALRMASENHHSNFAQIQLLML